MSKYAWYCRCHPINLVPLVVTNSSHGYTKKKRESWVTDLSRNAIPVDLDPTYPSFCKIVDDQLKMKTIKHSRGPLDLYKAWWSEDFYYYYYCITAQYDMTEIYRTL